MTEGTVFSCFLLKAWKCVQVLEFGYYTPGSENTEPLNVFGFVKILWILQTTSEFGNLYSRLFRIGKKKIKHLKIPFPFWSPLIFDKKTKRERRLRGKFPRSLQVINEPENIFFSWFGFFGHAELVMRWRLSKTTEDISVCVATGWQRRGRPYWEGWARWTWSAWTKGQYKCIFFFCWKIELKLGKWAFRCRCCQILYLSPKDSISFVFTAVEPHSE